MNGEFPSVHVKMADKQLKDRGNKLFSQGKYEAAIETYSQAIVSHSNSMNIPFINTPSKAIRQVFTLLMIVNFVANLKCVYSRLFIGSESEAICTLQQQSTLSLPVEELGCCHRRLYKSCEN